MASFKDLIAQCAPSMFANQYDTAENVQILRNQINAWIIGQAESSTEGEEAKRPPPIVLDPSGFETNDKQLTDILNRMKGDIEEAMKEWKAWIFWRRDYVINDMTEEDFLPITRMGLASWRGSDKEGRPCLVLTGRLLQTEDEVGQPPLPPAKLFQQYVIWMAEKGVRMLNEEGATADSACILYDRRAMEFIHLNTKLHTACKPVMQHISRFYHERIGRIYILHLNFALRWLFSIVLKPVLWLVSDPSKVHRCEDRSDLHMFFDSQNLLLSSAGLEGWEPLGQANDEGEGEREGEAEMRERLGEAENKEDSKDEQ